MSKELWIADSESLEITESVRDGQSYQRDNDGNIILPRRFHVLSVGINGVRFIPETNATRLADKVASFMRSFLEEEPDE